jgi:hypothetical protein
MPKLSTEVLEKAWGEHLNNQEKKRQLNVQKLIDYYNGDQEDYMSDYIKLNEKLDPFPFYWTKITKRVINKVAEVYKLAPQRFFGDNTEQDDKYKEITPTKNNWLKLSERQVRLLGTVGLRPGVNAEKKAFDYFMIRNFQAYFKNNNTKPFAIRYPVMEAANEQDIIYEFWSEREGESPGEHLLISANNVDITNPEMLERFNIPEDGINPYDVIPYTWLHSEEIIDDFWNTGGNANDLINANLHINMKLTEMSHKYRFKSFNPIYITGVDTKSSDIKMAYDRLMAISAPDARVGALATEHAFIDDIEVIKFEIQMIERNWNLNITWGIQGSAPSGFSLVVQNMAHMDDLEDFTDVARDWERQLLEMERKVAEVDKLQGIPEGDMRVDFTEIRIPVSQDEKNKKWEFEFKHGLSTREDYWRSENPDISQETIDERLERIKTEKEKVRTEPTVTELLGGGVEE